jgi:hypothetical protein
VVHALTRQHTHGGKQSQIGRDHIIERPQGAVKLIENSSLFRKKSEGCRIMAAGEQKIEIDPDYSVE